MRTTCLVKSLSLWLISLMVTLTAAATPTYVNLGLPSGTLWADCNVGAASPEDYGDYYAWGETTTKAKYTWANYQHADGSASTVKDIGNDIHATQYDAAYAWNGVRDPETGEMVKVCLPTKAQFEELLNKCSWEEVTMSNHKGFKAVGPNGNSIFLPFAGCSYDGKVSSQNVSCNYLTAEVDASNAQKANALYIKTGTTPKMSVVQRRTGAIIRAVVHGKTASTQSIKGDVNCDGAIDINDVVLMVNRILGFTSSTLNEDNADIDDDGEINISDVMMVVEIILYGTTPETNGNCPNSHHPHMIDLGLPSGAKWACCNLGATKPDEFGDKYAWGETEAKEVFTEENYLYIGQNLGPNICGTEYDVARHV